MNSEALTTKYQKLFVNAWQLSLDYRQKKQWELIAELLAKDMTEFEKLPTILKLKVNQVLRHSLQFFLNEALFHLKQDMINTQCLFQANVNDEKITQIKAKTYYMLYQQTNVTDYLEKAHNLARIAFGTEHKVTSYYSAQLKEKLKQDQFEQSKSIPNFQEFKSSLDSKYHSAHSYKLKSHRQIKNPPNTFHYGDIEKLTTQGSTFEPSRRIRTKESFQGQGSFDQKVNLFISSTKSLTCKIESRKEVKTSNYQLLRESVLETELPNNNYQSLLLQRPKSCVSKQKKQIMKICNQITVQNTEVKEPKPKPMKTSFLRHSGQQNHLRASIQNPRPSSRTIQLVRENSIQLVDKSIQVHISNPMSLQGEDEQPIEFSLESYQSYDKSDLNFQVDFQSVSSKLNEILTKKANKAAGMILENYRSYQKHKRIRKGYSKEIPTTPVRSKTNIIHGFTDLEEETNFIIEEKLYRMKPFLNVCRFWIKKQQKTWLNIRVFRQYYAIKTICGYKFLSSNADELLMNEIHRHTVVALRKQEIRKQLIIPYVKVAPRGKLQLLNKQRIQKSLTLVVEKAATTPKRVISKNQFTQGIRSNTMIMDSVKEDYTNQTIKQQTIRNARSSQLFENYFEGISQSIAKTQIDPPYNTQQQHEILLIYCQKNTITRNFEFVSIAFQFDFQEHLNVGQFIITTMRVNQKKQQRQIMNFHDYVEQWKLGADVVMNSLVYYRCFELNTKLQILTQLKYIHTKRSHKLDWYETKYTERRKLNRLVQVEQLVNMEHFYLFSLKKIGQPLIFYRLKQIREKWYLYVYQLKQPIYIELLNVKFLEKLQKLFKHILYSTKMRQHINYEKFKHYLSQHILSCQTSVGRQRQLGFQKYHQFRNIYNYELQSTSKQSIYLTVLKNLVANKSEEIQNVIRTFCTQKQYSIVSKIKNMEGMHNILFNEIKIDDLTIIEMKVFPFSQRFKLYKGYLNNYDLEAFELIGKPLEEIALKLRQCIGIYYNNCQMQMHLSFSDDCLQVCQLNNALQNRYNIQPIYQKQNKWKFHIFKRIRKIKGQFIVITVQISLWDWSIQFLIYIPTLSKQFKVQMTFDDFKKMSPDLMEQIIPSKFLEQQLQYRQVYNEQLKYHEFIEQLTRMCQDNNKSIISIESNMLNSMGSPKNNRSRQKYRAQTIFQKANFPQRVSKDYRLFQEHYSSSKQIKKFNTTYDYDFVSLIAILKEQVINKIEKTTFTQIYFWDQILESSTIVMNRNNKYIFQIDSFRGIIRQLVFSQRASLEGFDYNQEVYFEQSQVEYGSMFEKYNFVSLKESQQSQIYFVFKNKANFSQPITLKCQFRQCIYNFSKQNQITYSQVIKVLKQTSNYLRAQVIGQKTVLDFPKVETRSIIAMRTNKKTLTMHYRIDSHTKYTFIYQTKLVFQVLVTILQKNQALYFIMEDSTTQQIHKVKMKVTEIQQTIPHIQYLLNAVDDTFLGIRLLNTYKNHLIVTLYEKRYKNQQVQ